MPAYEADKAKFEGLNVQVLGISVDHVPCLKSWAESLGGISYPLLSDFWPHGEVSKLYGVLRPEGYTERAIFLLDPEGIIRYIDIHDIADQPKNDAVFDMLAKLNPQGAAKMMRNNPVDEELPHGGLVMYCTSWCPDCRRARAWLEGLGIAYREVDIAKNRKAAEQVRKWANGNETTPTFDVDGTIIVNFDERKLRQALKI